MEKLIAMPRLAAGALLAALCWAAAPVQAQEYIESHADWQAFHMEERDGQGNTVRSCFIVSEAQDHAGAGEGTARIYVTHRPWRDEIGIVSIHFPFEPSEDATITASIGPNRFDMKTWGSGVAWLYEGKDPDVVQSMKRGLDMVVVAPVPSGGQSTDTFSLRGFTAAYDEIATACDVN